MRSALWWMLLFGFLLGEPFLMPAGEETHELVTIPEGTEELETIRVQLSRQIADDVTLHDIDETTTATLSVEQVPIKRALSQLAKPRGWVWWKEKDGYHLSSRAYYEEHLIPCHPSTILKVYRPDRIPVKELEEAIAVLFSSDGGSVSDQRVRKIIVYDHPTAIDRIDRYMKLLEGAQEEREGPLESTYPNWRFLPQPELMRDSQIRVFPLENPQEAVPAVRLLLNSKQGATIADEKNGKFTANGREEDLRRVGLLVELIKKARAQKNSGETEAQATR